MGLVYADLSVSADGFSTGYNQREEAPFGDGIEDEALHTWMFEHGENHRAEVDAIVDARAFIMGRNMFGPVRGAWSGDWRGWWGENPPYHGPVFVLTHHPRAPVEMEGGTTFFFITDGVASALARAREAAGGGDISIAGGAETVNQFLAAGLLDVLRLHIVPLTVGLTDRADIVRVFDGVPPLRLETAAVRSTPEVTHLTYRVR